MRQAPTSGIYRRWEGAKMRPEAHSTRGPREDVARHTPNGGAFEQPHERARLARALRSTGVRPTDPLGRRETAASSRLLPRRDRGSSTSPSSRAGPTGKLHIKIVLVFEHDPIVGRGSPSIIVFCILPARGVARARASRSPGSSRRAMTVRSSARSRGQRRNRQGDGREVLRQLLSALHTHPPSH